ncbi:hypothetical protein BHM03_00048612 [Ensete ventricosum]|nr:hypothetical protein BHM03_00048612 [Ensete ventricosum]
MAWCGQHAGMAGYRAAASTVVLVGATPVEVPPVGVAPAAPWQGSCQRARATATYAGAAAATQ